jgi:hypothetical protein
MYCKNLIGSHQKSGTRHDARPWFEVMYTAVLNLIKIARCVHTGVHGRTHFGPHLIAEPGGFLHQLTTR